MPLGSEERDPEGDLSREEVEALLGEAVDLLERLKRKLGRGRDTTSH